MNLAQFCSHWKNLHSQRSLFHYIPALPLPKLANSNQLNLRIHNSDNSHNLEWYHQSILLTKCLWHCCCQKIILFQNHPKLTSHSITLLLTWDDFGKELS